MNKYINILATIALSLSLLCINNYCDADKLSICSKTRTPSVCNDTLGSPDNTCDDNDHVCMGLFVNQRAITATQSLKQVAETTSHSHVIDKNIRSLAKECVGHCKSAKDNLNDCKKYWKKIDKFSKSSLNQCVTGVGSNLKDCNQDFEDLKVVEPPLIANASNYAQDMISIMLAIGNSLNTTKKKWGNYINT
ncbi:hypothetical protein CASFOL_039145 [Castilleja foliolosa]|uniref:Pectinesterase inhibitor domain-containing protein n=1 Tax=Castilleja foliolosa TaxID=1961234 RepID=A0ABD3BI80_9LAMI